MLWTQPRSSINKALKINQVQKAVSRCKSVVALFSRSWKKNRDLHQKQAELGLPQHKLIAVSYHSLYFNVIIIILSLTGSSY